MATPSVSSIVNFVKMYPITLCGFSLLFMPSVHRLLLYFTPLLLSTAIFIVAMLSWGPGSESSDQKGKTRGKPHDWAFNGSFKIYGDEDEDEEEEEEEEEEEAAEVSQARKESSSIDGKASKKQKAEMLEPDPDFDDESKRVGTASIGAIFRGQAEPDPDLGGDGVETVSSGAIAARDLQEDCVGTASEPDPDLHGEHHVDQAAHTHNLSAGINAAPDHHCRQHLHDDYAKPAPRNRDEQAAGDHCASDHDAEPDHLDYHDAEPDHLDYHDAASDQPNHDDDYGDLEAANQGDNYHDAEPDPDLHGSDGAAAHAKSEEARIENDDVRAAIAELRQKLGLVQRAPLSDGDACEHRHSQQSIGKSLQTLQAAA